MITLVPTSHIAAESLENIRKAVEERKPDCIAVELDHDRYHAILAGGSSNYTVLKSIGVSTFMIYWLLKKLQNWLGKKTGIFPGSEMLEAIKIAKQNNIPFVFIDLQIGQTMAKIKTMPGSEKFKLIKYLVKTPFLVKFSRGEKIDLNKVPQDDIIYQSMEFFKKEFPYLYNILVDDRNRYMASVVKQLESKYKNIVVVIGAGHEKGMKELIKL